MRIDYVRDNFDRLSDEDKAKFEEELIIGASSEAEERRAAYDIALMGDYYDEIQEAHKMWGKQVGLSTGLLSIDRMTMGLAPGEMTVIAGATSNGKTALAINIAAKIALRKHNVLFVTLEMTKVELGSRFMRVMGEQFDDHMNHIFLQKQDELNWRSIDGLVKKAVEQAGAELVVIDHLHYFTRELKNVAEDLGNITKEFKKNAIRYGIPIILISHTRKGTGHSDTATGINDLRGSSYIAQDADIVLMVERERDRPDMIMVKLEKNRNRSGSFIGTEKLFDFNETVITERPLMVLPVDRAQPL